MTVAAFQDAQGLFACIEELRRQEETSTSLHSSSHDSNLQNDVSLKARLQSKQRHLRISDEAISDPAKLGDIPTRHSVDCDPELRYFSFDKRLSLLMKHILLNTGAGIDRGEITASYYGLERRYRGCYNDPCFRPKQERDYERRYQRVQPTITRALNRLERRGLVQLVRHGRYVKQLHLTSEGRSIAQRLKGNENIGSSG